MRIDIWDEVLGNYSVHGRIALLHEEARNGTRRRSWLKVNAGHSIFVDNDHRNCFAGSDQIVENKILVSLVTPTSFVFPPPMLQIKNRVTTHALVISRRGIDKNPSCLVGRF